MNANEDTKYSPNAATDGARADAPNMVDNIVAGVIAGIVGAIAVALAAMLYAGIATPEEGWLPMKNVAATWLGVDALIGGGGTIALGLATHFGTAIGWGVVLALLLGQRRNAGLIFVAGLLWGAVVVYVLMTWLALPYLNPTMNARVTIEPAWWWWVLHLIFGVMLGVVLTAFGASRRLERRA